MSVWKYRSILAFEDVVLRFQWIKLLRPRDHRQGFIAPRQVVEYQLHECAITSRRAWIQFNAAAKVLFGASPVLECAQVTALDVGLGVVGVECKGLLDQQLRLIAGGSNPAARSPVGPYSASSTFALASST